MAFNIKFIIFVGTLSTNFSWFKITKKSKEAYLYSIKLNTVQIRFLRSSITGYSTVQFNLTVPQRATIIISGFIKLIWCVFSVMMIYWLKCIKHIFKLMNWQLYSRKSRKVELLYWVNVNQNVFVIISVNTFVFKWCLRWSKNFIVKAVLQGSHFLFLVVSNLICHIFYLVFQNETPRSPNQINCSLFQHHHWDAQQHVYHHADFYFPYDTETSSHMEYQF